MHHALAAAQAADQASYTGWTVGFIIGGVIVVVVDRDEIRRTSGHG